MVIWATLMKNIMDVFSSDVENITYITYDNISVSFYNWYINSVQSLSSG